MTKFTVQARLFIILPPPQFYRFYNQKRTFLTPEFFFSKLRTLEKNTTKSHTHTQYVSYSLYGCYKLVYEIYGSITYGIQLFRNYKFWFISFCYAYFEILTINVNIEETIWKTWVVSNKISVSNWTRISLANAWIRQSVERHRVCGEVHWVAHPDFYLWAACKGAVLRNPPDIWQNIELRLFLVSLRCEKLSLIPLNRLENFGGKLLRMDLSIVN